MLAGGDGHSGYSLAEIDRILGPFMDPKGAYLEQLRGREQQLVITQSKLLDDVPLESLGDRQARPRDIDRVAAGCPFIAETLAQGGANLKNEIQWHDMMAVACYCDDPQATAHRLCQGNQYYNPDDTVIKLAEAQKAREQNPNLGFPFCATLEKNGAPQCATCKYRQYGRSPLNTPQANEAANEEANYGLIPEVIGEDGQYQPIPGGYYPASDENLARLNRRICRVLKGSDTLFYENRGPGGHQWRKPQAVEAAWAGAHMKVSNSGATTRPIPMYKWYMDHTGKLPPALPVFRPQEPPGHIGNNEHNMWSGWGVQPDPNYKYKGSEQWSADHHRSHPGCSLPGRPKAIFLCDGVAGVESPPC